MLLSQDRSAARRDVRFADGRGPGVARVPQLHPPLPTGPAYALAHGTDGMHPRRYAFTNSENPMLLTVAIVLFVLWALGFLAFHVTAAAIHLILLLAVIALIMHFIRGRTSAV